MLIDLLEGDIEKVDKIFKVRRDVGRFLYFKGAVDLGINFTPRDLSFSDLLVFGWIKDAADGSRSSRV